MGNFSPPAVAWAQKTGVWTAAAKSNFKFKKDGRQERGGIRLLTQAKPFCWDPKRESPGFSTVTFSYANTKPVLLFGWVLSVLPISWMSDSSASFPQAKVIGNSPHPLYIFGVAAHALTNSDIQSQIFFFFLFFHAIKGNFPMWLHGDWLRNVNGSTRKSLFSLFSV